TRTIRKSGEHLLAIVNDVLDFSSIERGSLSIHVAPLDIPDLVKSSEQAILKTAADKGLLFCSGIGIGVPERILGDELRIRQILINILGNAVKFTSNGSVTHRIASVKEEGGQFLDFAVEDTGIGMSPETMGILFHPFTQAEMKMSRTFGGTGLGLAISQRLAEAMGGKITVASTPGKGSTFTLRLPLEVPCAGGMASVPSHLSDWGGITSALTEQRPPAQTAGTQAESGLVLVVDDDTASGVVAVKMLQNLGFGAECVSNGAEAVESFVVGKYSAILMDIAMPVMDGLVATRKIREIEAETGFHVPIIAFTANVMPGDRERCIAAGMEDFLAKPFKKNELAAKLAGVR
ncbi:MAG: ATP-binding protein, partial [Verrucomicrobiota bacterium]